MSKRYNQQYNHQRYIQHHRIKINTTFLPMLCSKSSIKDVAHPTHRRLSDEGMSPKVGCMGQLKSTTTRAPYSSSSSSSQSDRSFSSSPNHHRPHYLKLRKIFSGKNILVSNVNNTNVNIGSIRGRGQRIVAARNDVNQKQQRRKMGEKSGDSGGSIDVDLMDPPLPVVKKVQKPGDGESLWKRRSAVKGLQLQQIEVATAHHHHHQRLQPTITV